MPDLVLQRTGVDVEDRPPMVVRVSVREGAWTPSPHCAIEAGPEIELNVQELAWLVEEAGPTALDALRFGTRELAEEAVE